MKTVLLVDDSTTVRNSLKSSLRKKFLVKEAPNGVDGLSIAQDSLIDVFVVDVNMPEMNGIELTRKLRDDNKYKDTPIILLTTETRAEKREEGSRAGATGWIVKPCRARDLISIIEMLLSGETL